MSTVSSYSFTRMTVKAFQIKEKVKYVDCEHGSECVTEVVELLQSDMLLGSFSFFFSVLCY